MFLRDVEARAARRTGTELRAWPRRTSPAIELVARGHRRSSSRCSAPTSSCPRRACARPGAGADDYSARAAHRRVRRPQRVHRSLRRARTPTELLDLVVDFEATAVDLVSEPRRPAGEADRRRGDVQHRRAATRRASIARDLIAHVADVGSRARGGIAHGPVITSGGDLYGEIVNLASRIADIAVPGEVLVNEPVIDARDDLRVRACRPSSVEGLRRAGSVVEPAGR